MRSISDIDISNLVEAIHSRSTITGLTHNYYRYPARFSPLFVREAIKSFSSKEDLIFDPFMGGGTTLVEAGVLGRKALGIDISSLASLISRVKTTLYSDEDLINVISWVDYLSDHLNLHNHPARTTDWIKKGYRKNISGKSTWPIRKLLELILVEINNLHIPQQQDFARCLLLKTAQWGLDCRIKIPSANEFRQQLTNNLDEMIYGAIEFRSAIRNKWEDYKLKNSSPIKCLNRSVIDFEEEYHIFYENAPKLILTSPPYPGVHVLYHRWQIQGRKETAAPYWIANIEDGKGESFYTFGYRRQKGLKNYYEMLKNAYTSISKIANKKTLLVQMVSFSEPSWQLSKYLDVMEETGFKEILPPRLINSLDGRLWRQVPNRKWYANKHKELPTSREVVLFHIKQ